MADKPAKPLPKTGKTFDIARPGKAAPPAAGSRPIIIKHSSSSLNPDPMVKTKSDAKDKSTTVTTAKSPGSSIEVKDLAHNATHSVTIKPPSSIKKAEDTLPVELKEEVEPTTTPIETPELTEAAKETVAQVEESPEETTEATPEDVAAEETPAKEPQQAEETPEASETDDADAELVDEIANQTTTKKEKALEEKASAERKEKVDKLVANKTYFVPIGQVGRKRSRRLSWVLLLLLLIIAAAVYLAIDAKMLPVDIAVPYEFIK